MKAILFLPQSHKMSARVRARDYPSISHNSIIQRGPDWWPARWTQHQRGISRRFSRLNYLAHHAPKPVQARWRQACDEFERKHFASGGRASTRYLNTYTCHAWM